MTDWNGWSGPSPGSQNHSGNLNGHALPMLLGRLLERTEAFGDQLGRIELKLERGQERFYEVDGRLRKLEDRTLDKDEIPRWERVVKRWVTYLLPVGIALATGSIDAAIRLMEALK